MYELFDVVDLPDEIITDNRQNVDKIEALYILLKRFAWPCRYGDSVQRFGRAVPELYNITKTVKDMIYTYHEHLLTNLNQPWLSPANLCISTVHRFVCLKRNLIKF